MEAKSACVVVADDNESLRYLTVAALSGAADTHRFDMLEADNGAVALAAIEGQLALGARVLLVSDNRMPQMTGSELVRVLRERHADTVRVAILTSAAPPPALEKEMASLGARIIERPSDLHSLRAVLGDVVADWLRR